MAWTPSLVGAGLGRSLRNLRDVGLGKLDIRQTSKLNLALAQTGPRNFTISSAIRWDE